MSSWLPIAGTTMSGRPSRRSACRWRPICLASRASMWRRAIATPVTRAASTPTPSRWASPGRRSVTFAFVAAITGRCAYPTSQNSADPDVVKLDGGTDLCAAGAFAAPTAANAAACALTNGGKPITVPTPGSPAGQYNGLLGGNPHLKPEVGKTTDVGLVLTPTFLPGFSATIDYADIKITDVITTLRSEPDSEQLHSERQRSQLFLPVGPS